MRIMPFNLRPFGLFFIATMVLGGCGETSWYEKDTDGDDILDVIDDYPFDATKHHYPVFIEQEPNDNPGIATPAKLDDGFIAAGTISSRVDKGDLFGFDASEGTMITAFFTTQAERFSPQVYISNADGLVIDSYVMKPFSKDGTYVVHFQLFKAGRYQLSVMDNNYAGGDDLSYKITVFHDTDVDAFDDRKERRLMSDVNKNDQDNDGIIDGLEYLLARSAKLLDADNDGQFNWQDDDSDGDGTADKQESKQDKNNNGQPDFLEKG